LRGAIVNFNSSHLAHSAKRLCDTTLPPKWSQMGRTLTHTCSASEIRRKRGESEKRSYHPMLISAPATGTPSPLVINIILLPPRKGSSDKSAQSVYAGVCLFAWMCVAVLFGY